MAKNLILSICCLVLLGLGLEQFSELQTFIRTDSVVISVTPYRNTTLAQVRYYSPDGKAHTGQINAEGRQAGQILPVMYAADSPQTSLKAYSPVLYLIPLICVAGSLLLLWLIWTYYPRLNLTAKIQNKKSS